MALVSITTYARLKGKHVRTIHRYISSGRLQTYYCGEDVRLIDSNAEVSPNELTYNKRGDLLSVSEFKRIEGKK